jgi:hypothetical protein
MTSDITYTEAFRRGLLDLARSHGMGDVDLIIAPSVQDWAHAVGVEEPEPFRAGMALRRPDGVPTIVLRALITSDIRAGILPALEMRGFDVDRLAAPNVFLEHLFLHEIAHLVLDAGASETECDSWASEKLSGTLHADSDDSAT